MNQHNNNVSLLDTPVPLAEDTLIPLQQVFQIFSRVQLALVCKIHPCMFFKLFSPALALVHLNRLFRNSFILFSGLFARKLIFHCWSRLWSIHWKVYSFRRGKTGCHLTKRTHIKGSTCLHILAGYASWWYQSRVSNVATRFIWNGVRKVREITLYIIISCIIHYKKDWPDGGVLWTYAHADMFEVTARTCLFLSSALIARVGKIAGL